MKSMFKSDVGSRGDAAVCAGENPILRAWPHALAAIGAAWLLVFYLFSDTAFSAFDQWVRYETYSHCFIIFPIAIYLIWDQRERIIGLAPRPNYWGVPILAMIGIVWLLGHLAAVLVVQQVALVAMFQVLVFTVVGWSVTRALLYPLGFLMFAVPYGDEWVRPLQDYTALFTVKALQLTGVPVFQDGWIIAIPSRTWVVAEACSGVRYIIAFVVLGYLFSYWTYRSWGRRLAFMLVCFLGGIVANGFRAYGSVMLAHTAGATHLIHGWLFFSIVVAVTFWVGLLWREPPVVEGEPAVIAGKGGPIHPGSLGSMVLVALGAVALLGLAPFAAHSVFRPVPILAAGKVSAPGAALPWRALEATDDGWKPQFLGAAGEVSKSYAAHGQAVQLYIAYYRPRQRQGAELIGAGNDLIPEKKWRPVKVGSAQATIDDGSVSVDQIVLRSSDRTRLVWRWYWVGGKYTSNPFFGKALEIKSLLLREQQGSALIAIAADVEDGKLGEAADTMQNFLRHLDLSRALEETN